MCCGEIRRLNKKRGMIKGSSGKPGEDKLMYNADDRSHSHPDALNDLKYR